MKSHSNLLPPAKRPFDIQHKGVPLAPAHRVSIAKLATEFFLFYRLLLPALAILMLFSVGVFAQEQPDKQTTNAASAEQAVPSDVFSLPRIRTESPRQTLSTFLLFREVLEAALLSYQENRNFERLGRIVVINEKLLSLIDFSGVPPVLREQIGVETLGYLLEIAGRVEIPNLDDVPDVDAYKDEGAVTYRIPKTPLRIVRKVDGERAGEFLFGDQTVQVAKRFYNGIQNLPLRSALPIKSWIQFMPQLTGPLIPADLVPALPEILKKKIYDTPIWKTIAVVTISLVAGLLLIWWNRAMTLRDPGSRIAYLLCRILSPAAVLVIITVLFYFFRTQIFVVGQFSRMVDFVHAGILYATMAWAFWLIVRAFFEAVMVNPRFPDESLDANLLRLIAQIIGVVGSVIIIAYGAQKLGVPVLSMLAGLGIGGIAIALAIRPTLENLIGGFILYIDKPIRVGDYCEFGDMSGTVETIGIRSTQVRSLDRTLISIPNAQFADMQIINWARCDMMAVTHTIGLRYETEDDQLKFVLAKIREMFHAHPKIDSETVRVRFSGYGPSSLDIDIRVYAMTREWNDFFAIKEDMLLRINAIVKQAGTSFAFPSQTVYIGKDEGLDAELGAKAKEKVTAWRRTGQLPFPRFASSKLDEFSGTLDYPQRGSPDFNATKDELADGHERLSAEPLEEQTGQPEEDAGKQN